jgi:hypothetical protein
VLCTSYFYPNYLELPYVSASEGPTTTNPHIRQQIEPVRNANFDSQTRPISKNPFAKSFTNRRWPSDLLRWPLALLLPSTHRNNNIALQRILSHLSHFASHPQTSKILAQKILMERFLGLNYNYLKPTNKRKYNSLHSCVSLSFFGQRFLFFFNFWWAISKWPCHFYDGMVTASLFSRHSSYSRHFWMRKNQKSITSPRSSKGPKS